MKELVRTNIRQKLTKRDERLLELKQAKINTIKCLRKMSEFTKGNFEDVITENFELKKMRILLETQVKLLKVRLVRELKVKKRQQPLDVEETFSNFGDRLAHSSEYSSISGLGDGCTKKPLQPPPRNSMKKSTASSTSTAASTSAESLQQELHSLKKQFGEKEKEYKIQLARMKTFYDKHLQELNLSKLNKKVPEKVAQSLTKETEEQATIRTLRKKLVDHEEHKRSFEDTLKDKEAKITDLKNRIANQGFTKLSKIIDDLRDDLARKDEVIRSTVEEMKRRDSLDYQLANRHKDEASAISWIIEQYLTWRQVFTDETNLALQRMADRAISRLRGYLVTPLMVVLWRIWLHLRDKVFTSGIDLREEIESQIVRWKQSPDLSLRQLTMLREKVEQQEQHIAQLERQCGELRSKLDAIVRLEGDYRTVLSRTD